MPDVAIAGAGIAGLASAIALARRGHAVRVFEQAPGLTEIGAGLQLSSNATRILDRWGVLERLLPSAVAPEAVRIVDAARLDEIARVPMGKAATARWGAPYLAAHRADLQAALLEGARSAGAAIETGAKVADLAWQAGRPALAIGGRLREADLAVGADGVHSGLREKLGGFRSSSAGQTAWRATFAAGDAALAALKADADFARCVTAFVHPGFHLVAYPLRGGTLVNFAAFTPARPKATNGSQDWAGRSDIGPLRQAMRRTSPALRVLAGDDRAWTCWPVHDVRGPGRWTDPRGLVLAGDAAHAMTPFAAQGAAMAIEDAETLGAALENAPDMATALARWEASRRPRVRRVARRGAWNGFTWHVGWPAAPVRNFVLGALGPERLAAQLDWLYGWDVADA